MKSITIHNLDDRVYARIEQFAQAQDLSLNAVIKQLLHRSLGMSKDQKKNDLSSFSGQWSSTEYRAFQKTQELFEVVESSDWE